MHIKVYTNPTCHACEKVKEIMSERGIVYQVVDISRDREATMELVRRTHQLSVPVVQVGDRFVIGFNKERLIDLLEDEGIASL
ncbi:glutaredoxin family protein [Acetomicrobium sp. UBA5826]|uniref:glutaredoxin family protein n=1 Tax=Acetomicrobium sp. UBA5826 TaxID=1946039 RepID=UPI00257A989B|nr:glutaredoxin family protein [Acetomicrobium sp. UBA5826]